MLKITLTADVDGTHEELVIGGIESIGHGVNLRDLELYMFPLSAAQTDYFKNHLRLPTVGNCVTLAYSKDLTLGLDSPYILKVAGTVYYEYIIEADHEN